MDVGRVILTLAQFYSALLILIGIATVIWLFNPGFWDSPQVAGLWFAIGGFGVLVALTILLVQYSR